MIRHFARYLDTHPLLAVALGVAASFVVMVAQRSL
jgi:hypothetical protein